MRRVFKMCCLWSRLLAIVPALWKLDIDSAFRRVPLAAAQRWAGAIAFMFEGEVGAILHCAHIC